MITGKINLSKIDKGRLFKGEKGIYLDFVMFETKDNKFGDDYMIKQALSKEDREAGVEAPILGNAKTREITNKPTEDEVNDLPF
jgi:hypothetical protein